MAGTSEWMTSGSRRLIADEARRSRRRRLRMAAVVIAMVAAGVAPASSAPVLCAKVTYGVLGGQQQTLVDDCWVSSPWSPQGGAGPHCDGPNGILDVCYEVNISHPMP